MTIGSDNRLRNNVAYIATLFLFTFITTSARISELVYCYTETDNSKKFLNTHKHPLLAYNFPK